MGLLRVSAEGETHGLDLHEHGISAYPEYVISSVGKPAAVVLSPTQHYSAEPGVQISRWNGRFLIAAWRVPPGTA